MCVIPHHLSSAPHPHGDEEQLFIQIAPSIFSGIICPSDIPHCLFSPIFHQSDKKCYSSSSGSEDERYVASSKGEITRHHFVVSYSLATLQVYCPAFSHPLMVTIIVVIFAPPRTAHHHHHHCRDFRVLLVLTRWLPLTSIDGLCRTSVTASTQ